MSPRPRSRTLGRAPTTRKALVGLGVAATALLAFPGIAGAQEADPSPSWAPRSTCSGWSSAPSS